MEDKDIIYKTSEGKSFYRAKINLTEKGRVVAECIISKVMHAVEAGGKGIDPDQREVFYGALDLIGENLRKMSENGIISEPAAE